MEVRLIIFRSVHVLSWRKSNQNTECHLPATFCSITHNVCKKITTRAFFSWNMKELFTIFYTKLVTSNSRISSFSIPFCCHSKPLMHSGGKPSCMQKRLNSVIWLAKFQREPEFKLFTIVQVYGARWFEHLIDRFEQSTWEPSIYNLPMLNDVLNKS